MSDKNKGRGNNPWGNKGKKGSRGSSGHKDRPSHNSGGHRGGQDPVDINDIMRQAKHGFDDFVPGNLGGGAIGAIRRLSTASLFCFPLYLHR